MRRDLVLYRRQNNAIRKYSIWKMHPDGGQRTRIEGIGVLFWCVDWGPRPQ
jgi:hypothetical protein